MATQQPNKSKPNIFLCVLAGSTAGAIEIAITYPFEFAKTRSQLNRHLPNSQKLPWPPFPSKEWYAGCTTLIAGNALKAAIRFTVFDSIKSLLCDENGQISGSRTMVAGFTAGIAESVFAVTPFESIKTQLIEDRKRAQPRMNGFIHGTRVIASEQGIRGFFKGLVPSTARQGANSAVRFTSYTTLKKYAEGVFPSNENGKLGTVGTFAVGGLAGIITVYATMPLDVIKTRMQSLEARRNYANSVSCAVRIFREEGILTFWSGALPRLGRLSLSGAIVFTVYEKMMELFKKLDTRPLVRKAEEGI